MPGCAQPTANLNTLFSLLPLPSHRRSGADKVSIGSDAVEAVEAYLARGKRKDGSTAIEQISRVYGAQARACGLRGC